MTLRQCLTEVRGRDPVSSLTSYVYTTTSPSSNPSISFVTSLLTSTLLFEMWIEEENRTHKRTHSLSMAENTNILYVYPNLPLVMSILLKEKYLTNLYDSPIVKQRIELGMTPLAQTAACQNLPLAGRVSHFIKNWEIITQDPWVLNDTQ